MQKKLKKFLKLEYYRKTYGITQSEIAGLLGIHQGSYSAKVNGRAPFMFSEMIIIHELLNKKAKKAGDEPLTLDTIFLS